MDTEPLPEGSLAELMTLQHELQTGSYPEGSPIVLDGEARIEFIRWNVLALTDELHEMLNECGWKSWATSRHVNETAAFKELVDAFHFFMNLCMVVCPSDTALHGGPVAVADLLVAEYKAKRQVNAQRQADGYTGLEKCPGCKRDLKDFVREAVNGDRYCAGCGKTLEMKMDDGSYQPV